MLEEKKYFFCYSLKLKNFLKSLGFSYELSANHKRTDKPYWVYLRSENFSKALEQWGSLNNYPFPRK
jgi:hypothetical protein